MKAVDLPAIRLKRIYDPPEGTDGFRIPGGSTMAAGDEKGEGRHRLLGPELAPSSALRKEFHRTRDYDRFRRRYLQELEDPEKEELWCRIRDRAAGRPITLLVRTAVIVRTTMRSC